MVFDWNTTTTPFIQSGTSATSLTVGTNKSGATLNLQDGAGVTIFSAVGGSDITLGLSSGTARVFVEATTYVQILSGNNGTSWYIDDNFYAIGGSGAGFGGPTNITTAPIIMNWSTATTPYMSSGTSATSLTIGTNNSGALLNLQTDTATTVVSLGAGKGLGLSTFTITTASGTASPTTTNLKNPMIVLTASLSGNLTVAFGGVVGMWFVDLSGITFNGNTITFTNGAGTTSALSALVSNSQVFIINCLTTATISINV